MQYKNKLDKRTENQFIFHNIDKADRKSINFS
jgi:hypothetical protein